MTSRTIEIRNDSYQSVSLKTSKNVLRINRAHQRYIWHRIYHYPDHVILLQNILKKYIVYDIEILIGRVIWSENHTSRIRDQISSFTEQYCVSNNNEKIEHWPINTGSLERQSVKKEEMFSESDQITSEICFYRKLYWYQKVFCFNIEFDTIIY